MGKVTAISPSAQELHLMSVRRNGVPDHTAYLQVTVSSLCKAKQKFFPHHPLPYETTKTNHINQANATGSLNSTKVLQPYIMANPVPHGRL